ncbi:MAG: GNAT family N-acetyltransferase [Halobacteriales archaeon]
MTDVHVVETDEGYEDALSVRYSVFVDEQGVDPDLEVDDHEEESTHFVAYEAGDPVGVARLREYEHVPTVEREKPTAKIERMAVLRNYRGRGLGRTILEAVEETARKQGFERARLHAQIRSAGFYEALGYERVSEEFEEAGIPHVAMEKRL